MGLAKRYQEEREALGWFPVDDKYVCPECLSDHVLVQAATEGAKADSCSYCHQRTPGKPLAAVQRVHAQVYASVAADRARV